MTGVLSSLLYLLFFYKENDGDGFLKSRSGLFGKGHSLVHLQHPDLHPAEQAGVTGANVRSPSASRGPTSHQCQEPSAEGSGMAANTSHLRVRFGTSISLFMHEFHTFQKNTSSEKICNIFDTLILTANLV